MIFSRAPGPLTKNPKLFEVTLSKKVLVLNSGSSSLKFKLFSLDHLHVVAKGVVEEIGSPSANIKFQGCHDHALQRHDIEIEDHLQALKAMSDLLTKCGLITNLSQLHGIGHRVVHGGESFTSPVSIDQEVLKKIEELIPLAPLHNPANILGIKIALDHAPDVPQVAVFDTAFHHTMPAHAHLYALPRHLYEELGIRRYGFHGTSYSYVTRKAAKYIRKPYSEFSCICLHLGNGASIVAVKNGKCLDTSMGLTPLEGLVMGTRCGDIDPAIILFMARNLGMSIDDIDHLLNRQSGLRGICGDRDMRTIEKRAARGDTDAQLALDIFCYRARKYIGAYLSITGQPDCIIFTGGIGENSSLVRQNICQDLKWLGLELDPLINDSLDKMEKGRPAEISTKSSKIKILVIPTDEELEIARQTIKVIGNEKGQG